MKNLTAEEKLAEKLRQQRLQEEADLQVKKKYTLLLLSLSLLIIIIKS